MTGATNNYGFYGALGSATNTWNLYMAGTASNYMAGSLGIGTTTGLTAYNLRISKTITGGGGAIGYGAMIDGTVQSDITSSAFMYRAYPSTQAATFTLTNLYGFNSSQNSLGAGTTITNQYGYWCDALSWGTNIYGYYGVVAASTNRWNLYMAGTAQNYLAGNTGIGVAAKTTAELSLGAGTTAQAQINLASSTAPTSPQDGDIWFDGTNLKIRVGGVTKTVTIV
jgi:hypothetical protein